jgi:hypothetical protein
MRRRGSVSFVVEVMRRRFPQNGATTSYLDRKSSSRISPIGAGGLSVTPLIEKERVGDPTIEAAKIAAKRFFIKPGPPESARADHWSDPSARGFPRVEPARPADVAVQKAAGDLAASPPPQPDGQAENQDPDAVCKVSSRKIQSTLCFDETPKNDQPAGSRRARAREVSSPTEARPRSRPTATRPPGTRRPRNPVRDLRNRPFRRTSSSQSASCAAERS